MSQPRWAYGVTTCPARRHDLLPQTLASLAAGGFGKPRLFVDGVGSLVAAEYERDFGLEVTARFPSIRTFGNWGLALAELYIRNPAAERYALFQDDLICVRNLRQYLEARPVPSPGYGNLFAFRDNEAVIRGQPVGWHEASYLHRKRGLQTGRGAVALVFDREAVLALLTSRHMVERPMDAHRGWRAIDGGIVSGMNKAGYKEYVHQPSLVQHTGIHSSMGNKPHAQAKTFPGASHDALSFLPHQGLKIV